MKLDLQAVAGLILNGPRGKIRAQWEGGKLEIDEVGFIGRLAQAVATVMGQHIFRGRKPDGSGPMPGRLKDGRPRGQGSAISRALAAVQSGPLEWTIAAHREIQGHLARIMRETEFRPPPFDTFAAAIRQAFNRSVAVGELGRGVRGVPRASLGQEMRSGGTARRAGKFGSLVRREDRDVWKGMGSIGWAAKRGTRRQTVGTILRSGRPR